MSVPASGGRYDFDDGGCYAGQWDQGKAHGVGVCTGPKGQGEFSGAWHYGYEVSGVYAWPTGTIYEGTWQNGKRSGLGKEQRGRWLYRGEWSSGFMGRYGVRTCLNSDAKYEGTWLNGLQDGYGSETYADGGTYQGQWFRGMRHGYGIRQSAPYAHATKMTCRSHAHASMTSIPPVDPVEGALSRPTSVQRGHSVDPSLGDESRGGFALRLRSEAPPRRRSMSERGSAVRSIFRVRKQSSTGDLHTMAATPETPRSIRSSGSTGSCTSEMSHDTAGGVSDVIILGPDEPIGPDVNEEYSGEWKNDRRSGFGIGVRSDGLRYEGEWFNNRKYGYGVTTFKDGSKEEGKYKNNVLILSMRKKNVLFVRASKMRERIQAAVTQASRASQMATQKGEIATARMGTATTRAHEADETALHAREDSEYARHEAQRLCPDFKQPGIELIAHFSQANGVLPQSGDTGSIPYHRSKSAVIPQAAGGAHFVPESSGVPLTPVPGPEESSSLYTGPPQGRRPPSTRTLSRMPGVADANQLLATGTLPEWTDHEVIPHHRPNVTSQPQQSQPQQEQPHEQYQSKPPLPQPTQNHDMQGDNHSNTTSQPGYGNPADRKPNPATSGPAPPGSGRQPRGQQAPPPVNLLHAHPELITDYFDQYGGEGPPVTNETHNENAGEGDENISVSGESAAAALQRRTTIGMGQLARGAVGGAVEAPPALDRPGGAVTRPRDASRPGPLDAGQNLGTKGLALEIAGGGKATYTPPSNLMTRDEVSKLSSQRRQDIRRTIEEEELLRSNPLRYFTTPQFKAWCVENQMLLVLLCCNAVLFLAFYKLLGGSNGTSDEPS